MSVMEDVSFYEQKLKILETETQAAHRRFCSIQRARRENSHQTRSVILELMETQKLKFECSRKTVKSPTDELQQELNCLDSKERLLAAMLEQCFQEDKNLSGDDLSFAPLLTDLRKKCSETMDQLEVSRERKAQEQNQQMSFRETVSAIGCYIQGELLGSDCFGWKRQDFHKFVQ
uniref:Uncharacterized protein n=1 Tax=Cryptomonas curvata TaxID=233186 RepID=A0A7S0QM72_9CRYP|eukprot:CAMPEP_0172189306 /NCGR_PEP_ID=MMETSP1050-20130122/22444_1 /TAXON_ID=233186 /ORGANISM="Cryptomonas curvata, Strain CCAP979/52" /LENGTH=174 /DNA_ID=CAMNT_0012863973 /DNA_START=91 /DNA_END=615 /DNA_ORIENTATION=-